MNNNILIVGGVPYRNHPKSIGGTTVLLKNLIQYCRNNNINYCLVSTNKYYGCFAFVRNYLSMLYNVILNIYSSKVLMVNLSSLRGTYLIYPVLFLIAKIWRKKIVFRMFAGNLKSYLLNRPLLRMYIVYFLKRSDLALFETKELIKYFNGFNVNTAWFPNVRERIGIAKTEEEMSKYQKKFVFMAHVKKEKGVQELIDCFKQLSKEYKIDIYGQLVDFKKEELQMDNLSYQGLLQPKDVFNTLKKYDCLILPTYWKGEGYPGIIIESFSLGVPCIATDWGGISEFVEEGINGFLIPPKNVYALIDAIKKFDVVDHLMLSQNAINTFEHNFNSDIVNDRIINRILSL